MGIDKGRSLFNSTFLRGLRYDVTINPSDIEDSTLSELFVYASREIHYPRLIGLLNKLKKSDPLQIMDLVFYIRSPRGGRGERLVGRYSMQWMMINFPDVLSSRIPLIPEHGRWDDLFWLFPGVLKLDDADYVLRNYVSKVDGDTLEKAREAQHQVVQFVCDEILKSYKAFSTGGLPSLLVKWAPSEGCALDKRANIVALLCENLGISPQEYRVIYMTPMRHALRVTETLMCSKQWAEIDPSTVPSCCRAKNHFAFRRRFGPKSKSSTSRPPDELVEKCISSLLKGSSGGVKVHVHEPTEHAWRCVSNLVAAHSSADASIVIDTDGTMYGLHGKSRIVSKAIALALLLTRKSQDGEAKNISIYRRNRGFQGLPVQLQKTLLEQVNEVRMTFTAAPSEQELVDFASSLDTRTVVYLSVKGARESKKLERKTDKRIIIWHLCSPSFSFREKGSLVYIKGFREDVFRYILAYGDFDPRRSLASSWKKDA